MPIVVLVCVKPGCPAGNFQPNEQFAVDSSVAPFLVGQGWARYLNSDDALTAAASVSANTPAVPDNAVMVDSYYVPSTDGSDPQVLRRPRN